MNGKFTDDWNHFKWSKGVAGVESPTLKLLVGSCHLSYAVVLDFINIWYHL